MAHPDDAAGFQAPADAYDLHVGRYGTDLAEALVEFVDVPASARVLDVGCGPGALTAVLAARPGAGEVAAVDPSGPFAAACAARVPSARVEAAPAEDLPFADDSFDAVLSQLVVNFLSDAPAGLREMSRVAVPGGTVAACVWDYAEGMTMLRAFWDAAVAVDPERASALDEGRRMPYCSPGTLAELWEGAGLRDVTTGPLVVRAAYRDFEDFWAPLPLGVGPSGAYCASLDDATRDSLKRECHLRLGAPQGPFELTARAWAVRGTLPARA